MHDAIKGLRLTIIHCEEDTEHGSWQAAILKVIQRKGQGAQRNDAENKLRARMFALQKRLADTGSLRSPDHFNTEDFLPNGKHFYAIKMGRIRAYGWFASGQFIISHYAHKEGDKLSAADTQQVIANWRKMETQNV